MPLLWPRHWSPFYAALFHATTRYKEHWFAVSNKTFGFHSSLFQSTFALTWWCCGEITFFTQQLMNRCERSLSIVSPDKCTLIVCSSYSIWQRDVSTSKEMSCGESGKWKCLRFKSFIGSCNCWQLALLDDWKKEQSVSYAQCTVSYVHRENDQILTS